MRLAVLALPLPLSTPPAVTAPAARAARITMLAGLAAAILLMVWPGTSAHAASARERAKAEAAAQAAREKELADKGLPAPIAVCQARLERNVKRSRAWEAFRWAEKAEEIRTTKATGKFSPRFPVDAESIAKFPGELRKKRKKPEDDEEWVPAEAWCGTKGDEVLAVDVFGPGEKR